MDIKKFLIKIKSGDGKVLLENFISLSSLQVVGMILPLITLPYILRTIGFDKYGIVVFAGSLIAYFQSLTDFSFRITAVRDVAVFRNSPMKLNLIYSKVIIVKTIFLLISFLVIAIIVLLNTGFYQNWDIYAISSLMLLGHAIFPEWFFQGIEKMKYITYLNLGIKIFFTICVFIFVKDERDYLVYPLLQGLGLIFGGIVGQILLVKKYRVKFILLSKTSVLKTIKTNFPLFVNQFVPTLYNNTSIFLLGLFEAKFFVGVYQAILTIINLCSTVVEIFSRVCFPYLNRKKGAFLKYRNILFIVVGMMLIGVLILHKVVFWYLDINYELAFEVLLILLLSIVGYTFYNIYGLNYFVIKRKDKLVMKSTLVASLTGFVFAFPLIYYFGILGTAMNLCLGRMLMGGGVYISYLKDIKLKK